jgi:phosphatidyl-myo-inositol dimannoside synthase
VTNDFPPKTGGIQTYLFELWRRLDPGRAVVLTASSHPDATNFDKSIDVVVERVSARTLYFPTRRARRRIEDAITRHDPALVLFDPVWPLGLLGPRLSRPYGIVVHGAELVIPTRIPLIRRHVARILTGAAVVIAAGPYPSAHAHRAARGGPVTVVDVSPGVDTARFHPIDAAERSAVRTRLGLSDAPLVASFSRLVPRKGMDTLVRASVGLAARIPGARVVIAGEGRTRHSLERLARRLSAPVSFLGRVDDATLAQFIAASDVMAMDCRSRWGGFEEEGFGIVFVEAAACGVAQVAGRSGGSHDAVVHDVTGLVVDDSRSVADLETALAHVLGDTAVRARMGTASRERAERVFNWDTLAGALGDALIPHDRFGSLRDDSRSL